MRLLLAALALSAFCALFNAQSPSIAHAYTQHTVVNSNGQYPLYDEGSTKLAAIRCYVMQYNPCGYDCGGDTCTRVYQPWGVSCPYIVKAKSCTDVTPYAGNQYNERYCAMLNENNALISPGTLYYTLHEPDPVWHTGYHFDAACDIDAQVMTTNL